MIRLFIFLLLLSAPLLRAQPSLAQPTQRATAPWPPPAGQLQVIIDTDTANEVDDQWAIALALPSLPETP